MHLRALCFAVCASAAGAGELYVAAAAPTVAIAQDLDRSRAAIAEIDAPRLMEDRDYAAEMLPHIDRLVSELPAGDRQLSAALESLRIVALTTLERRDEIDSAVGRLLARRPREPDAYAAPIYAALATGNRPLIVTIIEAASRNVPGVGWPELRHLLDREYVGPLVGELRSEPALRLRLAEALFQVGWPGTGEPGAGDFLRTILVEDRLARGDRRAAADLAAGIVAPDTILRMIVQPRFDPVLSPGTDRLEVLRAALATDDLATAEALAAAPQDQRRLIARVQHLRGRGRKAEALALLEPFIRDPAATAAGGEDGMWLINEAAYALVSLGRNDEARALMAPLAAMPLAEHPYLISASINYAEMLFETGQHQRALEHAERLQREAGDYTSDYGDMWIAASLACSLARLERAAEAAPQLERMRPLADVNPAALTMAYLCLGDDDSAAALMVRRLEGDDPAGAILALQDYSLSEGEAQTGELFARLIALRDRPEVSAALDRVGRVLTLPLARTYWGNF